MSFDPQTDLLQLFERHDVVLEPDEDWLLTDGDFPAIRASWQEAAVAGGTGRLDIDLVLDEERQVELSYAGGNGRAALERFARSDLPVLLAACWYVTDDRTLDLAHWEIGVRDWDAFLGRLQVEGADVVAPAGTWPAIADALRNESPAARLHWVRLFLHRAADGTQSFETLLDNEPWPAGDRALSVLPWPASDRPYSVRGLLMLDVRDY